jgi:ABC-type transport system involved in multi-copper enzyme maturation permease subunit
MANYATYAMWLLALLAWHETARGSWTPGLLYVTNPFWLLFGSRWPGAGFPLLECLLFLAGSLAISVALAVVSTRRIRAVTLRQAGRLARNAPPRRLRLTWFSPQRVHPSLLDRDPVYWRELHRRQPSGWGRAIWRLYGVVSAIFTMLAIFANREIAPGTAAFMVSIGLLMVSVTSATPLAEERAHGSLDLLMTTPLSSRAIVLGKWWGSFRGVPKLAILPGVLALGFALKSDNGLGAIPFAALIAAMVMAYGAVITSLGLALAVWQPRLGRAVGFSVAAYLIATVIYPTIALKTLQPHPRDFAVLWVSPFFGIFSPMAWKIWRNGISQPAELAMTVWVVLTLAFAYAILQITIAAFDRRLGRMPVVRTPIKDDPRPRSLAIRHPRQAHQWPR